MSDFGNDPQNVDKRRKKNPTKKTKQKTKQKETEISKTFELKISLHDLKFKSTRL